MLVLVPKKPWRSNTWLFVPASRWLVDVFFLLRFALTCEFLCAIQQGTQSYTPKHIPMRFFYELHQLPDVTVKPLERRRTGIWYNASVNPTSQWHLIFKWLRIQPCEKSYDSVQTGNELELRMQRAMLKNRLTEEKLFNYSPLDFYLLLFDGVNSTKHKFIYCVWEILFYIQSRS